jgi:predicted secreted protein
MASPTYSMLVDAAKNYIGEEKATGAIQRRMEREKLTQDSFSKADLQRIFNQICDVLTLYIDEEPKKEELIAKIKYIAS